MPGVKNHQGTKRGHGSSRMKTAEGRGAAFLEALSSVWLMFEALQAYLVSNCALVAERVEGVAFLLAAKHLYGLKSLNYICINISVAERQRYYVHCIYSDTRVRQFTSKEALRFELQ